MGEILGHSREVECVVEAILDRWKTPQLHPCPADDEYFLAW